MRMDKSKTFMAKPDEIARKFYLIDAADKVLGRVAVKAAILLRGKHKTIFTPHVDCGDHVIVINADKIRVTGKKLTDKVYLRYSGYPSGQKKVRLEEMLKKRPAKALELAIRRMIPRNPLGYKIRKRIKVYAGDAHPHLAQKPVPIKD